MNLIQWNNNKIEIAPEAYGIKAFRNIWNADKTQNKEKAVLALSVLYFMYDPRSEFQFEIDPKDRLAAIKDQIGLSDNWAPDKNFEAAVQAYKYLTTTTTSKMLESNRKILEKTRNSLENFELDDVDAEKRATVASSIFTSIEKSTELMVKIAEAERKVYAEVEEHSAKMRGKGTKSIGDEGLDTLFKND